MSTWLQDGKSAIQEAVADAFRKMEDGAKAGMQMTLFENNFQLIKLLIRMFRARRARSQERRAVAGATPASSPCRQCRSATTRE